MTFGPLWSSLEFKKRCQRTWQLRLLMKVKTPTCTGMCTRNLWHTALGPSTKTITISTWPSLIKNDLCRNHKAWRNLKTARSICTSTRPKVNIRLKASTSRISRIWVCRSQTVVDVKDTNWMEANNGEATLLNRTNHLSTPIRSPHKVTFQPKRKLPCDEAQLFIQAVLFLKKSLTLGGTISTPCKSTSAKASMALSTCV